MKSILTASLVLSVSALVSSGTARAADCANATTQAAMNQCAAQELEREDKKINASYKELRSKLAPEQQNQLKEVQLAWIKYKDLACKYEAGGVEGGSVYPMVLASCLAQKTRQRNAELAAMSKCEEGDVSCRR